MHLKLKKIKVLLCLKLEAKMNEETDRNKELPINGLPTNQSQLTRAKYDCKGADIECRICLEDYKKEDTVIYLPCAHYYHENCITDWFDRLEVKFISPVCPVCLEKVFNY